MISNLVSLPSNNGYFNNYKLIQMTMSCGNQNQFISCLPYLFNGAVLMQTGENKHFLIQQEINLGGRKPNNGTIAT